MLHHKHTNFSVVSLLRGLKANTFVLALSCILLIATIITVYISVAQELIPSGFLYNADALYIPAIYKDIVDHQSISGWNFTPAPYFFPDMPVFFVLNFITHNFQSAIILYGFIQSFVFVYSVYFLVKTISLNNTLGILAIIISTIFFMLISTGSYIYGFFIAIILNANHFSVTLLTIVCLSLLLKCISSNKNPSCLVFLYSIVMLMVLSDTLFFVQFVLPSCFTLLFLFLFSKISPYSFIFHTIALIIFSVIGYFISVHLVYSNNVTLYTNINSQRTLASIAIIFEFIKELYHLHKFILLLLMLFICTELGIFALYIRNLSTNKILPSTALIYINTFFFFEFIINLGAVIITGKTDYQRYIITMMIMPPFFGFLFIIPVLFKDINWLKSKYVYIFLMIVLIGLTINIVPKLKNISLVSNIIQYPKYIECLDRKSKELGLQKGLSNYWDAKYTTLFSHSNLLVVQIDPDLATYHWINNKNWYNNYFDFIMVDTSITGWHRLDETKIISRFGNPDLVFTCETHSVMVYRSRAFREQFIQKQP